MSSYPSTQPENLKHTDSNEAVHSRRSQLLHILKRLLGPLSLHALNFIESKIEWVELPSKRILVKQGDDGDSMYFLVSGRLQVVIETEKGGLEIIRELARGETVGEMSMITGEKRSASIYAIRDSMLVKISKTSFDEIISKFPHILLNISKHVINRLSSDTYAEAPPKLSNIAIIPSHSDVASREFCQRLASSLEKYGTTIHLNSQIVDELLGQEIAQCSESDKRHSYLTFWLEELEYKYQFVLYESDTQMSSWTNRCMRQADKIIVIGEASKLQRLGSIEQSCYQLTNLIGETSQELIIIHKPPYLTPSLTQSILTKRQVFRHHHLRWDQPKDFHRIARFISGNAIGLVLSGGGTRGYAHLGAIKALKEEGIPIDMAGGTSIGALFSSLIAMDMEMAEIYEKAKEEISKGNPFRDYHLIPFVSLMRSRKIEHLLERFFSDQYIEDLWLDYFCVSANLSKVSLHIHQMGLLRKAVRASMSLPGIFPPVLENQEILVDGGVLNNIPIDIMRERGAGKIIAVDLDLTEDFHFQYQKIPSTWKILKNFLSPSTPNLKLPYLMTTIWKASVLGSLQKRKVVINDADIFLNPPVGEIGILDWKTLDRGIDIGYEYTKKELAKQQLKLT